MLLHFLGSALRDYRALRARHQEWCTVSLATWSRVSSSTLSLPCTDTGESLEDCLVTEHSKAWELAVSTDFKVNP